MIVIYATKLDIIDGWYGELERMNQGKRGAAYDYPDSFVQLLAYVKAYFHLPYRQIEGVVRAHAAKLQYAFLEYQKWIKVDWAVVQSQTSSFLQTSSQKMLDVVNSTAQDLNQHNLNHIDIAYPLLGVAGFVPGFALGLIRG
jgi:hypothetical protein